MLKKVLSLVLIVLMLHAVSFVIPASAKTGAEKEVVLAAKVKAGVAKLGSGPEAQVQVKLKDKTKLEGYISEISAGHFVVTDTKSGVATTVAYPQVKQVKGNNLSTGAKIGIGLGIAAAIAVIIAIVAGGDNEGPTVIDVVPRR